MAVLFFEVKLDFLVEVVSVKQVMGLLTAEELEGCFTLDYYFKNVDYILKRTGIL